MSTVQFLVFFIHQNLWQHFWWQVQSLPPGTQSPRTTQIRAAPLTSSFFLLMVRESNFKAGLRRNLKGLGGSRYYSPGAKKAIREAHDTQYDKIIPTTEKNKECIQEPAPITMDDEKEAAEAPPIDIVEPILRERIRKNPEQSKIMNTNSRCCCSTIKF